MREGMTTEDRLDALEKKACMNMTRRAWIGVDCCAGFGRCCRLTAVYHPGLGYDFLHHGKRITSTEARDLIVVRYGCR